MTRSCGIDPGKPVQNAFAESFIGSFRDECLTSIGKREKDYNETRALSSLGNATPASTPEAVGVYRNPWRSVSHRSNSAGGALAWNRRRTPSLHA